MPPRRRFVRRFKRRRASYRRRRYGRRSRFMVRFSRPLFARPHYFKYIVGNKDLIAGVTTNVSAVGSSLNFSNAGMVTIATAASQTTQYFSFAQYFTINMINAFGTLLANFDQYQIVKIFYRFVPVNNVVSGEASLNISNSQVGGFFHSVIDHDDATALTASDAALDSLRQRPTYKWGNIHSRRVMSRMVRPRVAVAAYGGAFSRYANRFPGWIDTISSDVQHYGIKGMFEIVNPSANICYINLKLEATFYFKLKDPL